jgi:hypothetical protein
MHSMPYRVGMHSMPYRVGMHSIPDKKPHAAGTSTGVMGFSSGRFAAALRPRS